MSSSWMFVHAKSGSVSRNFPRSSASTSRPASVSSCARMDAVHPNPTSTTSTGLSRVAIVSTPARRRQPVATGKTDGGHRVLLPVLINLIDVVVTRSRKTYQLPAREIAVASIDRIGKKAFASVFPQDLEELLGRRAGELDLAFFQAMENFVLVRGAEAREIVLERASAIVVDVFDRGAIELGGCELELIALLLGSFAPGALHVPGFGASVRTRKLPVDEECHAGFLRARSEIVGRNESAYCGIDECSLRGGQVDERSRRFGGRKERARSRERLGRPEP